MRNSYTIKQAISFDEKMQHIAIKALIALIVAIGATNFFLHMLAGFHF